MRDTDVDKVANDIRAALPVLSKPLLDLMPPGSEAEIEKFAFALFDLLVVHKAITIEQGAPPSFVLKGPDGGVKEVREGNKK